MRLEAVLRTLTNNTVVSRVWVAAVVPAGVAMTTDQVFAIWGVPAVPGYYAAGAECARIIGCAKNRGVKTPKFKLFDDNPRSDIWVEYIEHPDKPPIEIPAAPPRAEPTVVVYDGAAVLTSTTPF